jgi:hypothetical protein
MQVSSEQKVLEFDKVTSTNLIYFETNNHNAFTIMIDFLEIVSTFHTKLENTHNSQVDFNQEQKQAILDNRIQQKFELEVVHRYLNTVLRDGEENRDDNVQVMLGFYDLLSQNDRKTIEQIDNFAKQIPITTKPFITLKIDERFYEKLMSLFTGDTYLSQTGFNHSIIMSSKLFSTLSHLLGQYPTAPQLFMYYLGTRFRK